MRIIKLFFLQVEPERSTCMRFDVLRKYLFLMNTNLISTKKINFKIRNEDLVQLSEKLESGISTLKKGTIQQKQLYYCLFSDVINYR